MFRTVISSGFSVGNFSDKELTERNDIEETTLVKNECFGGLFPPSSLQFKKR